MKRKLAFPEDRFPLPNQTLVMISHARTTTPPEVAGEAGEGTDHRGRDDASHPPDPCQPRRRRPLPLRRFLVFPGGAGGRHPGRLRRETGTFLMCANSAHIIVQKLSR